MDIFDILTMIGGLCLFMFGMHVMGEALERRAGNSLRTILGKLTANKAMAFLTGLAVTAIIQSSSATTVMVVGFVNSGLLTLRQAINVIMGANVGTTVTAWILSLSGIGDGNLVMQLLKPTSFTPVLALIGVVLLIFCTNRKKNDTGTILLGFATLLMGMDIRSGAVEVLADVPAFQQMFIMFKNPVLGMLAGALLTGIIQSSSASVGILQALAFTGQVSYGAAIPIIMGQNIGTTVTALLSSVGTTKNARRTALVHLTFNVLGTAILLSVYSIVHYTIAPAFLDQAATQFGIAVAHTAFNILCTAILLPCSSLLEKIVIKLIPDDKTKKPEVDEELDERLLATPTIALEVSHKMVVEMAESAVESLNDGMKILTDYSPEQAAHIRELEDKTDHYEDVLGSYLVKLSNRQMDGDLSEEAGMLLKAIGDLERISDHAVNLVESAEEMQEKKMRFSPSADAELAVLLQAVREIMELSMTAFLHNDVEAAVRVEPLEQVIDDLREQMRSRHIQRLQQGNCSIETGFIWSDLLTSLERTGDHCSNLAGCVIDMANHDLNTHESLRYVKATSDEYETQYAVYRQKYHI